MIQLYPFQSAPPVREVTPQGGLYPAVAQISIRASRAGGDHALWVVNHVSTFQSAPPTREATVRVSHFLCGNHISIRASRAGGDNVVRETFAAKEISIRASRAGGDLNGG